MSESAQTRVKECDVVVLGLGPGGEHVATELAGRGLDVVAIDERLVGGECPYYGCVPTKMMVAAAEMLRQADNVDGHAGRAEVSPAWAPVAERIRTEATTDWDDEVAVERLTDAGAKFVRGRGRITAPRTVSVHTATGPRSYVGRRGIVLNTGTRPAAPPIPGLDGTPYWTNREIVRVTELPESLAVLGGGAIGCELAQIMAVFGVEVTVVEGGDRLIAVQEPEASTTLEKAFRAEGIRVLTGVTAQQVSYDDGFSLTLDDGRQVQADQLLVAAGRHSNLDGIGLEQVGLDPKATVLDPDERMRVADGVWAIGDITGKGAFTHLSMYQAEVAIRDLTDADGPWADYRAVSHITFTAPEVGAVGLTEEAARAAGLNVRTATGDQGTRGWINQDPGLLKLVADADRGVLVGGTTVGSMGGEVLGLVVAAVHAEIPIATLAGMHFAYPTFHRGLQPLLAELL